DLCGRRRHREEEGRVRRRSGGNGESLTSAGPAGARSACRRSPVTIGGFRMNPPAAVAPIAAVAAVPVAVKEPAYRRILLKLSGEALMGADAYGINREVIDRIVAEIAEVTRLGVEVAIVIGGCNIFRGFVPGAAGMDRATADYMGKLAAAMNALAQPSALRTG